jgi:hypothetical protein
VVGGILTIVASAGGIIWFLAGWGDETIFWESGLNWCRAVGLVFGAIGTIGGIMAMMKRLFGVALIGAVCATLSFGYFGSSFFIGLLAVILLAVGKDAFDSGPTQQLPIRY